MAGNIYLVAGLPNDGVSDIGVVVSPDLSMWSTPAMSFAGGAAHAFLQAPWISDDGSLWLALGNGLQVSTDGGNTWNEAIPSTVAANNPNLGQGFGTNAAMDSVTKRAVVVGGYTPSPADGFTGVIYWADPPYTTWHQVRIDTRSADGNLGAYIIGVGSIPGVGFVASGWGCLLFSVDATSWSIVQTESSGSTRSRLAELRWNGSYMLAYGVSTGKNIWKSSNGTSWTAIPVIFNRQEFRIYRNLYWSTAQSVWLALGQFVGVQSISGHSSGALGSSFSGVFKSDAAAANWTPVLPLLSL
jgi:hypothetical protein